MTHPLSDRISSLPVSQTLAMAAKARELKEQGIDIISLSLGEPDFNTPDFIKDAAIEAINQDYNSYTPVDGYAELKEAICTKFKRDNDLVYQPNQRKQQPNHAMKAAFDAGYHRQEQGHNQDHQNCSSWQYADPQCNRQVDQ